MRLSFNLIAFVLWASMVGFGNTNCCSQTVLRNGLPTFNEPAGVLAEMGQPRLGGGYPIIARGAQREIIQNTPIELRPNRPFHFYGNTVRRNYYGQSMLPFVNRR